MVGIMRGPGTPESVSFPIRLTRWPTEAFDVSKAISVFEDFEHSLQFWAYAARKGIIKDTKECINPLPHISLVHTEEQLPYLRARFEGLKKHHFFESMKHSSNRGGN